MSAAATFVLSFASAQTVAEGINYLDSHKYAKAKEVFNHNTKISSYFVIPQESKLLYFQRVEIPAE